MSQPQIVLFRNLMKQATQMNDYNFRAYAIRRIRGGFDQNRLLEGNTAQMAIKEGQEQLAVLTRQSVISRLYPSAKSVMDTLPTGVIP